MPARESSKAVAALWERARAIFEGYWEQPEKDRREWLTRLCEGDRELEAEVQRLLDAAPPSGEFLEPPADPSADAFATSVPELTSAPASEALHEISSSDSKLRYRVGPQIAAGGMGAVHEAWDMNLRRTVAMKVLHTTLYEPYTAERMLGRFLDEAQITGQLDHPGIVPVYEVGLDEDGRAYYTMPLIRGDDLRTVLVKVRDGDAEWTRARVLGVLQRICETLAFAHAKKVVHRDLKPANIMVGRFGEVYLMDWGLARVLGRPDKRDLRIKTAPRDQPSSVNTLRRDERETPDSPLVTMDGAVIGTPAYMSPEQARGNVDDVGPQSDVFALGCMLYELLAGRSPYVPRGARMSPRTVLLALLEGPPPPLDEVAAHTPPELAAICDKAMARDLADRYAGTEAMARDLRAFLEGHVVHAYEAGPWAELRKWVSRNRARATAVALAAVLVVVALAATSLINAIQREASAAEKARDQQLFDRGLVATLVQRAEDLWPASEHIDGLRTWLAEAAEVQARSDEHRATRESYAPGSPPYVDLSNVLDELAKLDALSTRVQARLDRELHMEQRSIVDAASAWADAIDEIRESPEYEDLDLRPQLGLVPIDVDPRSGFYRFGHLPTGEVPEIDSDGNLVMTPESGLVFLLLPGGEYVMGAEDRIGLQVDDSAYPREGPAHFTTVEPFFVSAFELTQAQWTRLTGANPSFHRTDALLPVESVTWFDCDLWLRRIGLALPSEAQWEYAARGGSTTSTWAADEMLDLTIAEVITDAEPLPIGSRTPNRFGLFDVLGNVSEWCSDPLWFYDKREETDESQRMFRGASFGGDATYYYLSARSAYRSHAPAGIPDEERGVRPIRRLDP